MAMTSNLETGKNFKIFADNLFSSLKLVKALRERGLLYVGTVRENRLKDCGLKAEKVMKKEGRGAMNSKVDVASNVVAVRWFNNKKVDMISSSVGVEPVNDVKRYDKKAQKKIDILCPAIIQEYNQHMGGVDLLDCLVSLYKFPLKSRRWYMYIFYHTVSMIVVTSWLWYRRHCILLKEKPMKLSSFQGQLAYALVNFRRLPGRPSNSSPPPVPAVRTAAEHAPTTQVRLDMVGHLPEWGTRMRCKMPFCTAKSSVKCTKCKVHLCLDKDRNCFLDFHTN